jgi:hypothetical protein
MGKPDPLTRQHLHSLLKHVKRVVKEAQVRWRHRQSLRDIENYDQQRITGEPLENKCRTAERSPQENEDNQDDES